MTNWIVLRQNGHDNHGRRRVWCKCKCGTERCVDWNNVRTGRSASCGCVKSTHEESRSNNGKPSPTYCSWQSMRTRCKNMYSSDYPRYGGRGIVVDPAWDDFGQFLTDMDHRPEGMTLDRVDTDGNYCKDNCRRADAKTQRANQRPHKRSVK